MIVGGPSVTAWLTIAYPAAVSFDTASMLVSPSCTAV
jgi:hypothetical protein